MKTLRIVTRGLSLVAADPYSEETIDKLKPGKVYKIDVKEDRSKGELNLYWAGLSFLRTNAFTEEEDVYWPTTRKLHDMLLDSLGYTEKLWRIDRQSETGLSYRNVVDSIAIDNMPDEEFNQLFERIKALVMARWGVDPWAEWIATKDGDGWRR